MTGSNALSGPMSAMASRGSSMQDFHKAFKGAGATGGLGDFDRTWMDPGADPALTAAIGGFESNPPAIGGLSQSPQGGFAGMWQQLQQGMGALAESPYMQAINAGASAAQQYSQGGAGGHQVPQLSMNDDQSTQIRQLLARIAELESRMGG